MLDISNAIKPKSSQLNADDLILGSKTIRIRDVKEQAGEQPIAIYFDGDDGKPYLGCKSMLRVMGLLWGNNALNWIGRSLTLFRDAKVTWGGAEVGGIRISHMSHINGKQTMSLTATKQSRKPYIVLPLGDIAPPKKTINTEPLKLGAEAALLRGSESLKTWFLSLTNDERISIKPLMDEYKTRAATNDTPATEDGVLDE